MNHSEDLTSNTVGLNVVIGVECVTRETWSSCHFPLHHILLREGLSLARLTGITELGEHTHPRPVQGYTFTNHSAQLLTPCLLDMYFTK